MPGVLEQVLHRCTTGERRPHDRQRRQDQQQPTEAWQAPLVNHPGGEKQRTLGQPVMHAKQHQQREQRC